MLNTLLNLIKLKNELPDAVGYDTYGPISFPLPEELSSKLGTQYKNIKHINVLSIRVDNFSSRVQKNLRILFSGDFLYQPRLKFTRRTVGVKYTLIKEDKEIFINEIPPNETISIEIFFPCPDFKIVQILSEEKEITTLMQKLAEARRYPDIARLKLGTYIIGIFALVFIPLVGYTLWKDQKKTEQLHSMLSEFSSCSFSIISNSPENESTLSRNFKKLDSYWQNTVLSSNKVTNFDDLKLMDQILWCTPNTDS